MAHGIFLTQKAARNYVVSTFRTYQHWLGKGFPHAINNAMKYAVGQLESGVDTDNIQQSLDDIETIASIAQGIAALLRKKLDAVRADGSVNS
jgi:hypothetical protein